jgi:membrane associated rhomboid family serine protease
VAFFMVTGPEQRGSFWFAHGVAISSEVLSSAPWRAVTALTLHADATHVLGNAISGTIFASAVQRRLGSGGAALAVVASGALGNLANAVYHRALGVDHGSLGASTAVFGAIGLLSATELVLHKTHPSQRRGWVDVVAPIIGGFALLGALGSGDGYGRTDLGAHLFGFLVGVILGLAAALPLRRATVAVDLASGRQGHEVSLGAGTPRWWLQATLGALAAAIVIGSWEMALRI